MDFSRKCHFKGKNRGANRGMWPSLEGRCFCHSVELKDTFFFAIIMIYLPAKAPSTCYRQFLLSSNPTALSLTILSPSPWFGEDYCVPLFDNCVIPTFLSLLEVWLRHLPPTCWGSCPWASASRGALSSWGGPDNAEKQWWEVSFTFFHLPGPWAACQDACRSSHGQGGSSEKARACVFKD